MKEHFTCGTAVILIPYKLRVGFLQQRSSTDHYQKGTVCDNQTDLQIIYINLILESLSDVRTYFVHNGKENVMKVLVSTVQQ